MYNSTVSNGFTLIEVLISLSILVIGMLGISTLQNEALKYTHMAFNDSQAQFLLNDIIERIRANPGNNTYSINYSQISPLSSINCKTSACSPNQMASWDISQWRKNIEDNAFLPRGESQIDFDSTNRTFEISIRYDWRVLNQKQGQEEIHGDLRTISVKTRIE